MVGQSITERLPPCTTGLQGVDALVGNWPVDDGREPPQSEERLGGSLPFVNERRFAELEFVDLADDSLVPRAGLEPA